MRKEEIIERYGEEAYNKMLKQTSEWKKQNQEIVEKHRKERDRRGGKNYEKHLLYNRTGLQRERNRIRTHNHYKYKQRKAELEAHGYDVILHDEWIGNTAERRGVAFVDRDMHEHGVILIIEVMDGEITLLREK